MSEKKKIVVQEIIAVLAKNECTVAEAKLFLAAAKEAILEQTTVHLGQNGSGDASTHFSQPKEWVPGKGWCGANAY